MPRPLRLVVPALLVLGLLGVALRGSSASPSPTPAGDVTLTPMKFDALIASIAANKAAKYTVVDAWATWCGPCKDNFPHVVEMHKKYADKGLAVVSLSLDNPTKPKKVAEAREFLVKMKAEFPNYLLDESEEDAFEKLKISAIPAVFVFGPDGKEVKRFTLEDVNKPFTYEEVEEYLRKLVAAEK